MPATERRKFDEPTFAPRIDQNSQLIAARRRPDGLPAHELLYETAREIAAKKEAARRALEAKALAECRFRPALVAAPLAKEGRALRLAGSGAPSAPTSRRGSEAAENEAARRAQGQGAAGAQQGAGGGAEDEMVHIDALERQINDALVRLSLTGEQVAAHLAEKGQQPGAAQQQGKTAAAAAIDARQSLDYRALFGSPSPVEIAAMSERATGAASSSGAYLSAAAAGEGLGAPAATPASKPEPESAAIEW